MSVGKFDSVEKIEPNDPRRNNQLILRLRAGELF
jgi:hypothetical protein